MLIVFSGLPGVGKSTVSRAVASRLGATYLRIDAVEQAILRAVPSVDPGTAGYEVAIAVAEANLELGHRVVADCVNPVLESRMAWRAIAERTSVRLIEVEIICSDPVEHRRRIESRGGDILGHVLPTWDDVVSQRYDVWDRPPLVVDTGRVSVPSAIDAILATV